MSCGPEKAWPTDTGFGSRSTSRKKESSCVGQWFLNLRDKGVKLKIMSLLLMKQKLCVLTNRRTLHSLQGETDTEQIPSEAVSVQRCPPPLCSRALLFTLFFLPSTSNTDIEPLRYISSPGGCFHTHFACKGMEFTSGKQTFPRRQLCKGGKNRSSNLVSREDRLWDAHSRTSSKTGFFF